MNPLKKVNGERSGICGVVGYAHNPTYAPPCSSRVVILSALMNVPHQFINRSRLFIPWIRALRRTFIDFWFQFGDERQRTIGVGII